LITNTEKNLVTTEPDLTKKSSESCSSFSSKKSISPNINEVNLLEYNASKERWLQNARKDKE
jgi:hypothetical protein